MFGFNLEKNEQEVKEVLLQLTMDTMDSVSKQTLYNRCKSIIDHDCWYTKQQRDQIYQEALKCKFFTKKQKDSLAHSSIGNNEYEYEDDGADSDEDRRWCD